MRIKISLLIIFILANTFAATNAKAFDYLNFEVERACANRVWSDECQSMIQRRDFINNLKQIPRRSSFESDYSRDRNRNCRQNEQNRSHRRTCSNSEFLNMYLQDYSDDYYY